MTGLGVADSGSTVGVRSIVTEVSLGRPPVRPAEVARDDLLGHYALDTDRKLILVSAPAGYGKSILAAQWCTVEPDRPSIWIVLSEADNDPVVLANHLVGGLHQVAPSDAQTMASLFVPTSRVLDIARHEVSTTIVSRTPMFWVLDDVHQVTSAIGLALVSALIDAQPRGGQVLLATRTDPDIALARRRANGELIEIRSDQLAMDIDTTNAFLSAARVSFDRPTVTALHAKTEGWPAGIGLAVLSHDGRSAGAGDYPLAELSGEQREIADYLFDEVLARQAGPVRRFLLNTSVVARFSGELCDEMLDAQGSASTIRELEQTNAFVIPLDNHRTWYRYHHLFQEMLAAELDRTDPAARRRLLGRAAAWHHHHGNVAEAILYAQQSGDLARAGQLVLNHWQDYATRNQLETLRLWVGRNTDTEIASDASLAIGAGWVYTLLGDADRAERYAAAAAQHPLDVPSSDGATSLRSALANLRAGLGTGGVNQMLADGLYVEAAERPARTRWLTGGLRAVGTAHLMLGHVDDAIVALEEAVLLTSEHDDLRSVRIFCLGYLALAYLDRGEVRRAETLSREAVRLIGVDWVDQAFQSLPAETALAAVRARSGDRIGAARDVTATAELLDVTAAVPWMLADLSLRCAETAFEVGEAETVAPLLAAGQADSRPTARRRHDARTARPTRRTNEADRAPDRLAHPCRTARPAPPGNTPPARRDRRRTLHHPLDGQEPREVHLLQARRHVTRRSCRHLPGRRPSARRRPAALRSDGGPFPSRQISPIGRRPARTGTAMVRVAGGATKDADVPTLRFHDLRHLGNTLAANRANLRELMARMGHASPQAALIYQHATRRGTG